MKHQKNSQHCPLQTYFAASNSGHGFVSYFQKVFARENFEQIYILKGGPGTGKSSLMKAARDTALSNGYTCEAVLCSSDPSSYDGVIMKKQEKRIAILDGTAPHATDTEIPGAVDQIIDLGVFWNSSLLWSMRESITELISNKSSCYSCAYAMLKSAECYALQKRKMICGCIDKEKLRRAAKRLLSGIREKDTVGTYEYKLKNAISADGVMGTDIYENEEGKHFAIIGAHGGAFAFFDALISEAEKKSLSLTLSPSPLSPDIYDAIAIPEEKMYFYCTDKAEGHICDKVINTERFFNDSKLREIKPTLRALTRLEKDATTAAVKMLDEARKYHFTLEEIFISAMDFEKKELLQKELFDKII